MCLGRNELIFKGSKFSIPVLEMLLNIRSLKWVMVYGGLHKDMETLWGVNPVGSFLLNCKTTNESEPL